MSNQQPKKTNHDEMPNVSNQQLQEQIVSLQEQFISLRDQVEDSNKELHKTKHSMEGIEANFLGFTKLFDRYYQKLDQIHESLLIGQYHPRLTKVEAQMELKALAVLETKNDLITANTALKNELAAMNMRIAAQESEVSVLKAKAADTDKFKTEANTTVSNLKYVVGGNLIAALAMLAKLFIK